MENWKPVFDENGKVMLNGNNIVLQNINNQEIGYIEDNSENRESLSLPINHDILNKEKHNEPARLSEDEFSEEADSNKLTWNRKLTKLLIVKRLGQEQAFNRPKCKKIKLWNDIAKEINKDTKEAFSLTGTLCDNKYRNLLKTYKINKKKQKSSGESAINWEYFSDFDGVLGCKASIDPPDNTIYDTLDNDSNKDSENNENTSRDLNLNLDDVNSQPRPSNISKEVGASSNKTMKYQQYLYLKNKREEEKEKFQQKKWDEEKELRGEETAAILKLVEALKKK